MSFGNKIVSLHNGKCIVRCRKAEGSLEFTPVPTLVIGYLSSIDETRNQNLAIKILKGQLRSAPVPPSPLVSSLIVNKQLPSKRTSEPQREKTKTVSFAVKSNVAKRKVDAAFSSESSDEDEDTNFSANQFHSHFPQSPPPMPAAAACTTCISDSNQQPTNFGRKCPKCPSYSLIICQNTDIFPGCPKMVQVQPNFGPIIKFVRVLVNEYAVIEVPESPDPNVNRRGITKPVNSDGTFYVPVLNVTKQPILLRKERSLGKCQILQ